jgi:FkbM family methyltransferase
MHADDHIANDLYWHGFGKGWEGTSLKVWTLLVPEAATIVDVGSNVGVYALAAATVNPKAEIIAFEPLERTYERLISNIGLNEFSITAELLALSDRTGVGLLYDSPLDDFKAASLEAPRPTRGGPVGAQTVPRRVRVVTFDDYCLANRITRVDLVKIDIEGHEAAALRGMAGTLRESRPTLLLEVLTDEAGRQIRAQLEDLGYEFYRVRESRGLQRTDTLDRIGRDRNYLVCQPAVAARTALRSLALSD